MVSMINEYQVNIVYQYKIEKFNNSNLSVLVNNQIEFSFNPLYTENPYTGTLANSKDPDEIQDLHCLLRLKQP